MTRQIELFLNGTPIVTSENITVSDLVAQLQKDPNGLAIAINQTVISKKLWRKTILCDGDHIAMFQAIAGG